MSRCICGSVLIWKSLKAIELLGSNSPSLSQCAPPPHSWRLWFLGNLHQSLHIIGNTQKNILTKRKIFTKDENMKVFFIGLIPFQTIYALLLRISKCREICVFCNVFVSKTAVAGFIFLTTIKNATRPSLWFTYFRVKTILPKLVFDQFHVWLSAVISM